MGRMKELFMEFQEAHGSVSHHEFQEILTQLLFGYRIPKEKLLKMTPQEVIELYWDLEKERQADDYLSSMEANYPPED